ncbi:Preprotein translocase subunit SECE1 [Platanthera zijinensis]|uniref:Preprotein translocase subunit SECE1 n=1 Tax=Platanthera zijinensis TaxID=2320716 RepID=A0AAP0BIU2_9ASPA
MGGIHRRRRRVFGWAATFDRRRHLTDPPHRRITVSQRIPSRGKNEETQVKEEKERKSAAVIRATLDARKARSKMEELMGGMAEEIMEIEWPEFGMGTIGIILALIAGSSVILLTVNAIPAELSDRIFVE